MEIDDVAHEDGAAIPQLWRESAELVPGVGQSDAGGALRNSITTKDSRQVRWAGVCGGDTQLGGKRRVEGNQPGRADRGW